MQISTDVKPTVHLPLLCSETVVGPESENDQLIVEGDERSKGTLTVTTKCNTTNLLNSAKKKNRQN